MTHPDREGSTIYYTEAKCAVLVLLYLRLHSKVTMQWNIYIAVFKPVYVNHFKIAKQCWKLRWIFENLVTASNSTGSSGINDCGWFYTTHLPHPAYNPSQELPKCNATLPRTICVLCLFSLLIPFPEIVFI